MTVNRTERWTVTCQDPKDGSDDFIIDLPPDLLAELGLGVGDVLTIEVVDDSIVLRPKPNEPTIP
ncbi:AbrB/MazE/SpoVT family DNA-binding domain-containing protein [Pseudomonas veronii]|uniref:AbrB/MazE/SpoVT family DNA-binding domain-containing protein n=1 Tax=Pseudomonas TaxID=286 RepID=UPI0018E7662C|nr:MULTISPECIES: AbrB/MazE/SpoVT family DNA-binding domain-containing protein [Pseudomonas]MBJ2180178.1 AbrB/MazE/SpoVT family DNA-binding domain-containing protein [Pseudomonas veronii]MDB1111349.1 AbrB/MazE/SpoVT family DNA-binding domain-containing protein [Pseudomonas extremaustralis]